MKKIYITTAIPYVNAEPHIGHALEFVQADTVSRFYRLLGDDTYFSSGSDENSLKNVQAAEAEGIKTRDLVKKYADRFEALKSALNLTFDVFNRTATKDHFAGAQKLWKLCKKEDIYKKIYKGLYCVGCEVFYTKDEIVDGRCPDGHTNIDEVREENYFFRLSIYADFLYKLISTDKLQIIPGTRKNEVLSFIKQGLADFSISRSVDRSHGWGVPVPGDGSQIQYVWFDALTTYLTALGFGRDEKLYKKWWVGNPNRLHVIGKGIIRFHAVYWPAMLASAGLPLPKTIFVHGYVTVDGQKISKSLGNVIDPFDLVEKFGVDGVRYYLLREIPAWGDGDFSLKRFGNLYNGELANGLGNLVARVARLASDTNLSLPASPKTASRGGPQKRNFKFKKVVSDNLKNFRFDQALLGLWKEISALDRRINEEKPWELEGQTLKKSITPIAQEIREIAFNLSPFLPEASNKILEQFTGKIAIEKPLFPRI